ncbi:RNA exonuclease 4 [Ananas comosus]|uniref:RNA exonuclease 4 n=2 Tax=Ananas comosus TaxID=4615 RepID=A0A199W7B7_ANACO|nr:RNA exonuclease 4 [Ananas comosus]OAY85136.1 RNA exonuclease 4 [Ananas comosus]
MGDGATATINPNPNPNAKPRPSSTVNPNWEKLQSQLKSRRRARHPKPFSDPDAKTLAPRILGKRNERPEDDSSSPPPAIVLVPTSDDSSLTKVVAMDCEMVGVSSQGNKSALGRVTLVNSYGNVVYNEYVRPVERIVDFRTSISGIRPKHMKKAKEFWIVQKQVADIIQGRILVGHALHNDLKVLLLSHPKKAIRDTSEFELFRREGRRRALKDLAAQILGARIQLKEHCPIEDARAAMFIYNKHKKDWEKSMKSQLRFKEKHRNRRKKKSRGMAKVDVSSTPA